ncbi:MAG: restriction endonuclease subunit S [Vogesella sp.]|uniref:restriction endonuclease subunit S n=1 Tax=Vogesella sp. TaxID=1904252 RepID=UPI00391AB436
MSAEWISTTWGEIASLEYGKAIRDYQDADGTYIVYGTNGPIGKHHTPLCNYPSVIVGRKGAYRGIHYSAKPFFVIDTAFYLKPKAKLNTKWAYYCLLTYDINGMDSGSAIPSTSRDEFYKLPVLLPSENECNQIAEYLTAFDDRIALLRETNATLEAMAQALFKSWFVDFDPVHANAGNRAATLPAELQALFPSTFIDTPQGPVPEGWSFVNLGELVCNQTTTFKFSGVDEVVFVNTGDVAEGVFLHKNYSPVQGLPGQAKKAIQKDDILFSEIRPKNKRFAYVNIDPKDYVVSTKFMVLRAIGDIAPRYIYQILKQDVTIDFFNMIAESRSGTFPQITFDSIQSYQVLRPSKACVDLFIDIVQPIIDRIDLTSEQAQTLATLRDTLLPRLISGQLRLPDAEAALAEAGV